MPDSTAIEIASDTPIRAGVCYVFGVLFPVLYLLSVRRGKQQPLLRYHSFQSLLLFSIWLPLLIVHFRAGWPENLANLASTLCLAAWISFYIQAQRRKRFHLPFLGFLAETLTAS